MADNKRIALVTGGNKGIGLEIARQLARAGVLTIVGTRDPARGKSAVESLAAEGLRVEAVRLDVDDPSSIADAASQVAAEHGKLDILVNNAGSKAALNMLTVQLCEELRGTKIAVNSVSPGFVKTDLTGYGTMTPEEGAKLPVRYALQDDDAVSGQFVEPNGESPW